MMIRPFVLIVVWIVWFLLFRNLISYEFEIEEVKEHSGIVVGATCFTSRSINDLKLRVVLSNGQLDEKYFNWPYSKCDEKLKDEVLNKEVFFTEYKQRVIGWSIEGRVIKDSQKGVKEASNATGLVWFTFFIAVVFSVLAVIKKRSR